MDLQIKLTDEQLKGAVSEAVVAAISQQDRQTLLREAVQYLLEKDPNGYDKLSPIQRAFRGAIDSAARDACKKAVEDNQELQAEIAKMIAEAVTRAIGSTEARQKLVENLADKIGDCICPRRY